MEYIALYPALHKKLVKGFREHSEHDFLRVKDVATILNVSERTVREWILTGDLNAFQPAPRTTRVYFDDAAEFIIRSMKQNQRDDR
ncbi:MAG TPA: DNA-binding protein [Bacteroidetes bacterium]|nr:helix-turn-helix domain protein [bacterium BMS3Bbin04]HDO64709.1 DNA-binding protein [Bacteroidota bacterium]HEX03834.1 DNA-binding protein [Bacteroidota bacterium]